MPVNKSRINNCKPQLTDSVCSRCTGRPFKLNRAQQWKISFRLKALFLNLCVWVWLYPCSLWLDSCGWTLALRGGVGVDSTPVLCFSCMLSSQSYSEILVTNSIKISFDFIGLLPSSTWSQEVTGQFFNNFPTSYLIFRNFSIFNSDSYLCF